MFKNLLKRKDPPPAVIVQAKDAASVLAKLRGTTTDPDLKLLIDMLAGSILRDQLPMLVAVKRDGIRLKQNKDSLSLVEIHDLAFASLESHPFKGRKPISANAREGGRKVAEIMDGVIARERILADDENNVNRMSFQRIMFASSLMIEAANKITFLPPLTKEQRDADSNTAA